MLEYPDLRQRLGVVFQLSEFEAVVEELRQRTEVLMKDEENQRRVEMAQELFAKIR